MYNDKEFKVLVGKTLSEVKVNNDTIFFNCTDGTRYQMYHSQDCCESVTVEDVCGDIEDIIGSPVLVADEVTSRSNPDDVNMDDSYQDSFTWTFYKIDTAKGGVTIRWYGSSNGYYSESVDFCEV